jgi:diacylglycerol kinase (ATP)
MKTARLIYNPTAGREAVIPNLSDILNVCEDAGYITSTYATKSKGDATRAAREAAKMGFDLIIAAGGDGTVYEVINGIAPLENKPKLAILPLGTSNDFASALNIPKHDLHSALQTIKKGKTKKVDIGKVNDKYFINVLGGGKITELSYEVPSKLKTFLGQFAYYVKGIEKLTTIKSFPIKFTSNEVNFEGEVLLFLVSNSHIVGSIDRFFPEAKIDDGMLDVLILKKCSITELAKIIPLIFNGKFKDNPHFIHFRTNKITIKSKKSIPINLDGELGCYTPCGIELIPKHIEIIC